jgi:hypothetical protein
MQFEKLTYYSEISAARGQAVNLKAERKQPEKYGSKGSAAVLERSCEK